jgi:ABC-type transport system involved in multi-copper enzyme maturation permease subunit
VRQLLAADWLRFRRRRDFWIIGIAVLLFSSIGWFAGWQRDVTDPVFPSAAEIRAEIVDQAFFEGTPEEVQAQIEQYVADQVASYEQQRLDWEAQQEIALQHYDLFQSPFTLIGPALIPTLALLLVATLAVGDEFRFGTVRTSLLAASGRRRFLTARLVTLFAAAAGLFVALVLVGLGLSIVLRLAGGDVRTAPAIEPIAAAAWIGTQILTAWVLILFAAALTVLLRSGALPFLLVLIAAAIELFVLALPAFLPGEFLAGVPQAFLTNSVRTLSARLGYDSHALALAGVEVPTSVIELPLIVVTAIVVAWGGLFYLGADRRFRTMDIVE